jgi:hypothetical protein
MITNPKHSYDMYVLGSIVLLILLLTVGNRLTLLQGSTFVQFVTATMKLP